MTQNDQAAMNEQLTELRLNGLSIDGDNRYKQDLIDAVIGALIFGAQGANPPPAGHWLEQFYVIGREEREARAALATQPAAGEPVAFDGKTVADRLDQMADAQPSGSSAQSDLYAAATVWRKHLAPPAAAHGDEAVLWIECDPSAAIFDRLPKDWQFLFSTKIHPDHPGDRSPNVVFPLYSAMRAQGDGV